MRLIKTIEWNSINKKSMILVFGNMLEFYDLSVYGLLATTMAPLFFPNNDIIHAYILSFGVFSIAYIARPLGALGIGYVADKFGRKNALILSLLLMSLSTGTISLLPTYEKIGLVAPILLIFLRILQGISTGGEFPSSCIYLLEQNRAYRGLLSSLAVASGIVGMLFGSIICYLTTFLNVTWAWRIPFAIGMFIGLICAFIRKHLAETAQLDNSLIDKKENPILKSLINFKSGLITIGITSFPNILFYTTFFYFDILVKKQIGLDISSYNPIFLFVFVMVSILFGLISNRIPISRIMFASSSLCFMVSMPIFVLSTTNSLILICSIKIILVVLVAAYMSVQHGLLIDLWPTKYRCSGISIYFSIGGAFLGGTAPMILLLLTQITGIYYIAALYLMIFSLIAFLSVKSALGKINDQSGREKYKESNVLYKHVELVRNMG